MHVIYCMYDSRVNERFLPHNSGICITTSHSSSPYLHGCCCVAALWILWLSIVAVRLVLHLAPPFPVELFSFPSPPPPPIPAFASVYYEKETGEEEASERGGWGWEERAREHERRGREGCRGVREKGKWLCACVSGSSAPWQIQCWCHWSCLMWGRVYLFSPLETHACTVWKFYQPYFFFFYSTSSSSSLTTVVFRNVFMWAHFHSGEGLFSPRSRPQPPCLMPLHWVVCTFELNIKICCPVCSLLPSPFTSARLRFLPSLVTGFNLPSCFPSSSVRCHWWRGTSASLVGGLWRGKEDYFSN